MKHFNFSIACFFLFTVLSSSKVNAQISNQDRISFCNSLYKTIESRDNDGYAICLGMMLRATHNKIKSEKVCYDSILRMKNDPQLFHAFIAAFINYVNKDYTYARDILTAFVKDEPLVKRIIKAMIDEDYSK